jgi:hypothetical protein
MSLSLSCHVCVSVVFSPNQPIAVCWFNYPVVILTQWLNENITVGCFGENTIHTWRLTDYWLWLDLASRVYVYSLDALFFLQTLWCQYGSYRGRKNGKIVAKYVWRYLISDDMLMYSTDLTNECTLHKSSSIRLTSQCVLNFNWP